MNLENLVKYAKQLQNVQDIFFFFFIPPVICNSFKWKHENLL